MDCYPNCDLSDAPDKRPRRLAEEVAEEEGIVFISYAEAVLIPCAVQISEDRFIILHSISAMWVLCIPHFYEIILEIQARIAPIDAVRSS